MIETREVRLERRACRQWRASLAEVDSVLGSLPVAAIDTALVLKAVAADLAAGANDRRSDASADRGRARLGDRRAALARATIRLAGMAAWSACSRTATG